MSIDLRDLVKSLDGKPFPACAPAKRPRKVVEKEYEPTPVIRAHNSHAAHAARRTFRKPSPITESRVKILAAMQELGSASTHDIAAKTGLSYSVCRTHLRAVAEVCTAQQAPAPGGMKMRMLWRLA